MPKLTPAQRRELETFGKRIGRFGVNFAVVDAEDHMAVFLHAGAFDSNPQSIVEAAQGVLAGCTDHPQEKNEIRIWHFADEHVLLAVALTTTPTVSGQRGPAGVAIIDLGSVSGRRADATAVCSDAGDHARTDESSFGEMLRLLAQNFQTAVRTDEQIEMVGTELARVYEELVLLHRISTNMRVTESDANFLQLACDSLTDIVLVEGIAILLERQVDDERRFVVAAGSGLIDIDERMAEILHSRLTDEVHKCFEAVLDSEVDSPFRFTWPDSIRNIMIVPLCAKENRDSSLGRPARNGVSIIGLMVAVNRIDKPDFDSTDVKLFTSVASGCAVFIENGRLFKELFVGSLKALTNSIDAKDQYTRGHSERVAFISRWIAERINAAEPLDEDQIHKVYLAGLLHDIGKIGIDENVLRKSGKLTPEERQCIQRHPSIGASILRGIKQMRDIVPGVRYHHERMDGKGYPDGLTADEIPLTGKIVGLADSFDAMTSKRIYRDAMSVEDALDEIRRGLGAQFDNSVGIAFLESDVSHLWDMIQDGGTEVYSPGHFADYGTEAVGTLVR